MSTTVKVLISLAVLAVIAACAATPGRISQTEPVDEINKQQGLALEGYDPVAYFTEGKPVAGSDAASYHWRGATWQFSTPEHRDAFIADPERYAPQFGGYCAFAMSRGTTVDGDPHQWAIVDGKLYVNNNPLAMTLWNQHRPASIKAGNVNWPLIPKLPSATALADPAPR